MNMTLEEFKAYLREAEARGTLMTPKHDPNNLGTTYSSYRTVLSHELSANLLNFINSPNYLVKRYNNTRRPNSPLYFEIIPKPNSGFDIPASGVTSYSPFATTALDRIIAVSGQTTAWHLFGENSSAIQLKIQNGDLQYEDDLF